jgi:hypothetical protein
VTCPQLVESGAYVLGALPPSQRLAFEAHMAQCDECRNEVNELAVLPGLLGRVDLETIEPSDPEHGPVEPAPQPVSVLAKVIGRIHRRRRIRRFGALAGAIAAACLALFAGLAIPTHHQSSPPQQTAAVLSWHDMQTVTPSPITAKIALTSTDNGTTISVKCWYTEGGHREWPQYGSSSFALVVYPRSGGAPQQVGTWSAGPGEALTIPALTSWGMNDVSKVELRTAKGTPLLNYVMS